ARRVAASRFARASRRPTAKLPGPDDVEAATTILTVAAEVAASTSSGPGSFAVGLLDALANLDAATLRAHVG
ncbi:MAG TPA: hypothetical protein VFC48_03975, partial [Cellulomonas sp.]|nr:hypothetical protein [Cellulomonas sp.]